MKRFLTGALAGFACLLAVPASAQWDPKTQKELDDLAAAQKAVDEAAMEAARAADEAAAAVDRGEMSVSDAYDAAEAEYESRHTAWNRSKTWLCTVRGRFGGRRGQGKGLSIQTLGYEIDFEAGTVRNYSDYLATNILSRRFEYVGGTPTSYLDLGNGAEFVIAIGFDDTKMTLTSSDETTTMKTTGVCYATA